MAEDAGPKGDGGGIGRYSPPVYGFRPVETRVLRSLLAGPAHRVTAIVAPMGFGKTVLMTQLLARFSDRAHCLWLGLDEQPVDLPRLLSMVEELVGVEGPASTEPMLVDVRAEIPTRIDAILRALARRPEREVILFLDNLNSCRDVELRLFLDALVFRAPRALRLYATSTHPIPFDSTQAMLEMKLRRVGAIELGFDRDDALALLAEAGIEHPSSETMTRLLARTEGWPAAIRLMQLLLLDQEGAEGERLDDMGTVGDDIAALLSRKLVRSFPPELTDFLLDICVLRHFSADLAEAATGNRESRRWIDVLVERNVLIVPTGASGWWRFHALFREFLLREATRLRDRASMRAVAARAAAWLAARGDLQQALDMAIAAPDAAIARALLERLARPMVRDRGDLSGFLALAARSVEAGTELGPDALFWQAWAMAFSRDYAGARAALQTLRRAAPGERNAELSRRLTLIEIVVDFHLDELEAVLRKAPLWLDEDGRQDAVDGRHYFGRAAVAAGLALALSAHNDFRAASSAARAVQDAIIRTDSDYGKAWSALVGATVEVAQGQPLAARQWIDLTAGEARATLGPHASIVTVLRLVEGRIAADLGDFAQAAAMIRGSLARAAANAVIEICWQAMEVGVELLGTEHEIVPLEVMRGHAHRFGLRLTRLLDLAELRRALRAGDHDTVRELAERTGLLDDEADRSQLPIVRAFRQLVLLEFLMAQGTSRKAEALAAAALAAAEAQNSRGMMVELLLVQAELAQRGGARSAAAAALSRAVLLAAKLGLIRPFLVRGSQMARLLSGLDLKQLGLNQEREAAFLRRLQDVFGRSVAATDGLAEALTPRELDILRKLSEGLSNAEIGQHLDLTLATVKWHLANIYSKLDVRRRAAALARARALGLLA